MRHIYVNLRKTPPSIYGDTLIYEGENLITNITFRIPSEDNSLTFIIKFKPYRLPEIVSGPLSVVDNTISYIFTNAVTAACGLLQVQLNGFDSNGLLIKYSMINFKVEKSISEADEIMPESYIPWYSEISNTLNTLNALKADITYVDSQFALKADKVYIHDQIAFSKDWTITHNLDKYPSVTIVDSALSVVVGEVQYINTSQVVLHFTAEFAGKAYLN